MRSDTALRFSSVAIFALVSLEDSFLEEGAAVLSSPFFVDDLEVDEEEGPLLPSDDLGEPLPLPLEGFLECFSSRGEVGEATGDASFFGSARGEAEG